jgi:predicted transcriptional regulator of viral defense system
MRPTAREYKSGLGKREASLIAGLAESGKTIFTADDARAVAGDEVKHLVNGLVRKKWVLPLKRGLYAFVVHNFVIASMLVEPYYIGFWSALNYHGLTEQIPRTTFIATTKPRHPIQALDAEYVFVRLTSRKVVGWEDTDIDGHRVHISTPEKTVADCLDHPERGPSTSTTRNLVWPAWSSTRSAWGTTRSSSGSGTSST